jgi:2-polyprenyl-6-methoxyphenol hydroxylase-like FAD-dependent oxidoreductase
VVQPHAVIAGAGIGGLTAALALQRRGWRVTVCERAPVLEPVGTGIALAPNALRALDVIGLGDAVRARANFQGEGGVRHPDGRWIAHTDVDAALRARFGDPIVLLHRADLVGMLADGLGPGTLQVATAVTAVDPGGPDKPASVTTHAGELTADLVVAADGIRSLLRTQLFPAHPGTRYAGYTAWRMVVPKPAGLAGAYAETWGRGMRFAVVPLGADHLYCYATANTPPGQRYPDERAELVRRFGGWHDPIPAVLSAVEPQAVLRHDIEDLVLPLPPFHRGRVALLGDAAHAMTPDIGQGGCLAIEDGIVLAHVVSAGPGPAAGRVPGLLEDYTSARRPRAQAMVRRARRVGKVSQWSARLAVSARDLGLRLAGALPPALSARALDSSAGWNPPDR